MINVSPENLSSAKSIPVYLLLLSLVLPDFTLPSSVLTLQVVSVETLQVVVSAECQNCRVSQVWHISFDFPHEKSGV